VLPEDAEQRKGGGGHQLTMSTFLLRQRRALGVLS
jgi:hypothetical protein